jgi:hypothetical protein
MFFSTDCGMQKLKNSATWSSTEIFSMTPLSMSYIMNNNLEGNIDTLVSTYFKECPTLSIDKTYSEKTLTKIVNHELIADKAYSTDPTEFNTFIDSYIDLVQDLKDEYSYFRCVDHTLIGRDSFTGFSLMYIDIGVSS